VDLCCPSFIDEMITVTVTRHLASFGHIGLFYFVYVFVDQTNWSYSPSKGLNSMAYAVGKCYLLLLPSEVLPALDNRYDRQFTSTRNFFVKRKWG